MPGFRLVPRLFLAAALASVLPPAPAAAQWPSDDAEPAEFALAMNAKILCSGVFVQHRDAALHAAADLKRFDHFGWADDFTYEVDRDRRRVVMSAPGQPSRIAHRTVQRRPGLLDPAAWRRPGALPAAGGRAGLG